MRKLLHLLPLVLAPVLFAVALAVLHRRLEELDVEELTAFLRDLPAERLLLALALSAGGYALLTLYDGLAFRYIGRPLTHRRVGLAAFVGYAFSNTLGHTLFTGTPIRLRFYSAWGYSAEEIARVVAFGVLTHWVGFLAVAAAIFSLVPLPLPAELGLAVTSATPLGWACLALLVAYVTLVGLRRRPLRLRGFTVDPPSRRMVAAQVALGGVEWTWAATVLYVLLGPTPQLSFAAFAGVYLLTYVAALTSQVPGGLGVFETLVVLLLTPRVETATVVGALVVYRVLYHFLPLTVAALLLAGYELWERRRHLEQAILALGRWSPAVEPPVVALVAFLGGAALLFSVATPTAPERLAGVALRFGDVAVELAHVAAGAAGAALLVLARGLHGHLRHAYALAVAALAAGVVAALVTGPSFLVASFLLVALATLVACRRHFGRRASLTREPFTPGWLVAIALALLSGLWLAAFSYKDEPLALDLMLHVAPDAAAARSLRGLAAAGVVLGLAAAARVLRPSLVRSEPATPETLRRVAAIAATSPRAVSQLAVRGETRVLFDETRRAFLMVAVEGRTWVALDEPVGDGDATELLFRFRELCARHDGRSVVLRVSPANLPRYREAGLTVVPMGDEGYVDLAGPLPTGGDGVTVLPTDDATALPEVRQEPTLRNHLAAGLPVAVLRRDGTLQALAGVLSAAPGTQVAIDRLRLAPGTPVDAITHLVAGVARWARDQGYRDLTLGLAPPATPSPRALAAHLDVGVYLWGEHFASPAALRRFKETLATHWEPRYLAAPAGLALPSILADLGRLGRDVGSRRR